MQYYDAETKLWKSWAASTTPQPKIETFLSASLASSKLFLVVKDSRLTYYIYSYDTEKKVWENIPHSLEAVGELCTVGDYMYPIRTTLYSSEPQRYNFVKRRWQRYAKLIILSSEYGSSSFHNSGTTVFHSKVYVLYGRRSKSENSWRMKPAILVYFDPVENKWERKSSTCCPHFGSTLFEVNGRLYVGGGNVKITNSLSNSPYGDSAPVEVYDEQNDSWSVVKQDHIPPNKLGAVEIEGRVFFIINRFPIDSGIRIPPGEKYHVDLDDWENLGKVNNSSVLCYLPAYRENLSSE